MNTKTKKKIGIIDSGIGGLTLLKEAMNKGLDADFLYIGDSENVPYGNKSQEFMFDKMSEMSAKLIDKNIDCIFIACNTATAQTIDHLREKFPKILFLGMEPYINYLKHSKITEANKIALILTQATFDSERFQTLRKNLDEKELIDIYPLKKLALIIEKLRESHISLQNLESQIYQELDFLLKPSINYQYLILGCTHYPIIKKCIEQRYKLKCINPAEPVIRHLQKALQLTVLVKHSGLFISNFDNSDFWSEDDIRNYRFLL